MKRLCLLLFVSLALLIPRVGFAQGTETLEPAEYKPPQVGTRIEYSKWACTVEEVDGFATKCRLDRGGRVTLYGWLEIDGNMPRLGYFADRSYVYDFNRKYAVLNNSLRDDDQDAVEEFWPLKLGKEAEYKVGFVTPGRPSGRWASKARVETIESLRVGNETVRTFVIDIESKGFVIGIDNSVAGFRRRLWYSPDLGLVVKEEFEWTAGPRRGQRYDSVLRSARLADGTSLLGSSPAKPPTQVTSVPERPARPVTQPPKPEVNRDALAPAEYVAPEVGTRIEYSTWTCTVVEVDGFRTKCRLDEGGSVTLFAWIQVEGKMPRSGYFADRSYRTSHWRYPVLKTSFDEDDLEAIASLWPMEVGKVAQFTDKFSQYGQVFSTANVESTELVEIDSSRLRAFVIMVHSRVRWGNAIHSDFMRRLWYSPDIGMVVKENFEWTKGERKGRRFDYVLRSVRLADGTRIFPPPAATPVVRVEAGLIEERLESVQDLLEQGLITKEEAAEKRQEILDEL